MIDLAGSGSTRSDAESGRLEWEQKFQKDFPDASQEQIEEAWQGSEERKAAEWLTSMEGGRAAPESDEVSSNGLGLPSGIDLEEAAAEWEVEVATGDQAEDSADAEERIIKRANELEGPEVSRHAAIQSARAEIEREDREARHRAAQPDAPKDTRAWNRRLINEQGPALGVGGTRGPAPKAPTERGFDWEDDEKPPPYAVEADEYGIHAQSPVTFYAERARDDFDSSASTPYVLTKEDGSKEWRSIGGFPALISQILSTRRPLDEWQVALRRGRRTAEASSIRAELAVLIARLVDVQGAQAKAVAEALGRGRDAVHALLREGRAKSDT
jgi:hypothetical protein